MKKMRRKFSEGQTVQDEEAEARRCATADALSSRLSRGKEGTMKRTFGKRGESSGPVRMKRTFVKRTEAKTETMKREWPSWALVTAPVAEQED